MLILKSVANFRWFFYVFTPNDSFRGRQIPSGVLQFRNKYKYYKWILTRIYPVVLPDHLSVTLCLRRLPISHTCFNQICLPPYRTRKELKHKLTIAISNAEGFGLEWHTHTHTHTHSNTNTQRLSATTTTMHLAYLCGRGSDCRDRTQEFVNVKPFNLQQQKQTLSPARRLSGDRGIPAPACLDNVGVASWGCVALIFGQDRRGSRLTHTHTHTHTASFLKTRISSLSISIMCSLETLY